MNQQIVIGVLVGLLVGLGGGYYLASSKQQPVMSEEEHEIMDETVQRDGAMQHAMDEMSLELRGKEGEEYEKAFLDGMIVHHLGAIEMAKELLTHTERPELVAMANAIIEVQTDEIEMMKAWRNEWFNEEQE